MDSKETITASLRAAEDLHFEASMGLEEAALDFFFAHKDVIEEQAAAGCESAQELIVSVDEYLDSFNAMDNERIALVDAEYR